MSNFKTIILLGSILVTPAVALGQSSAAIQAGLWEVTLRINEITVPGAPTQAAQAKARTNLNPPVERKCIPPKDAKDGLAKFINLTPNCHFSRYDVKNGTWNTTLVCPTASEIGPTIETTSTGNFTDTNFTLRSTVAMKAPGGNSILMPSTTSTTEGKWLGTEGCKW
jgi:hypothetical protein